MCSLSPVCNKLLKFTSGVTPANLMVASMAAKPFHLCTCIQALVGLESRIKCAAAWQHATRQSPTEWTMLAQLNGVWGPWSPSVFFFAQISINLFHCVSNVDFSFNGRTNTDWKSRGIDCTWRCNWNVEMNLIWDYEFWKAILFFCRDRLLGAFWAVWLVLVGSKLASTWHTSCFVQCVGSGRCCKEKPNQSRHIRIILLNQPR